MTIPLLVWQLIPVILVLLPLLEAVAFAVYWRGSVSNPWLYGVLGVVLAYTVAVASVFVAEKVVPRGGIINGGYFLETPQTKNLSAQKQESPSISLEPFTLGWNGLLFFILVASALGLWGLKALFAKGSP